LKLKIQKVKSSELNSEFTGSYKKKCNLKRCTMEDSQTEKIMLRDIFFILFCWISATNPTCFKSFKMWILKTDLYFIL